MVGIMIVIRMSYCTRSDFFNLMILFLMIGYSLGKIVNITNSNTPVHPHTHLIELIYTKYKRKTHTHLHTQTDMKTIKSAATNHLLTHAKLTKIITVIITIIIIIIITSIFLTYLFTHAKLAAAAIAER